MLKYMQQIICKIFGIWIWRQVLRISWVRIFWDRQRACSCRIGVTILSKNEKVHLISLFSVSLTNFW